MGFENNKTSKVELVNFTPNPESFVVFIARVSNPQNQSNPEIAKLIAFLIKNKHWSPFEHAFFTFKIVTSRAVAAQLLRHRSFSFQEFSQRYSEATEFEPIELRRQAEKNRQSSTDVFDPDLEFGAHRTKASLLLDATLHSTYSTYRNLLKVGVAKESARMILPLTTQTTLYMSGSIRSWIHYLQLRLKEDTQKEHRLIAESIAQQLRVELPVTFQALDQLEEKNIQFFKAVEAIRQYQKDPSNTEEFLDTLLRMPL